MNDTPHNSRASRPSRLWLLALPVVAAGLGAAIYTTWPRIALQPSHMALARFSATGTIVSATAHGTHGAVALAIRHNRLWPTRPLSAGTKYTVRVTLQGPRYWPVWTSHVTDTLTTPRDPRITATHLIVAPGKPLSLALTAPASAIRVSSTAHKHATVTAKPGGVYILASPSSTLAQHGHFIVQTQARTWEAASAPITVHWKTPGWLKVAGSPASGQVLTGNAPLVLTFSHAVANPGITPTIEPAVAGHWTWENSHTEEFIPSPSGWGYAFDTTIKVQVPGGRAGYTGIHGAYLPKNTQLSWTVAPGSTLRLQEVLAHLGYLPLRWTPSAPVANTVAAQVNAMEHPPSGQFHWAWPDLPASLTRLWVEGHNTVMLKGAIMNFERVAGLPTNGHAGPVVWKALIQADLARKMNPDGYTYAYVSENSPETLTLYHNGVVVLKTLCNTGIPQSPTPLGTFPVYLRYRSQTMQGINPFGEPYYDPGVPYVNYFNGGDAVHGFPRAAYGFPQSLGCVELPIAHAKKVWPYMHYGTLVTVTGPTA